MPMAPPRHNAARVRQGRLVQQREYNQRQRTGSEFYKTRGWRKLRAAYVRQYPICEDCREQGRATPVDVVDHVTEIKDGGDPLAWDNLRSLCHAHHNAKTARGRAGRISTTF